MGHFTRDCRAQGRESGGRPPSPSVRNGPQRDTNQVHTLSAGLCDAEGSGVEHSPSRAALNALYSDSGDEEVCQILLNYRGSKPQHICMEIQGVSTEGMVDTGANITIIGGNLFIYWSSCKTQERLEEGRQSA